MRVRGTIEVEYSPEDLVEVADDFDKPVAELTLHDLINYQLALAHGKPEDEKRKIISVEELP